MATHYIVSSSNTLYVTDTYYFSNPSNSDINVTVLDEGVGTNCKYHLVTIEDASLSQHYKKEYYVLTSSIMPLSGTSGSAPRICVSESQFENTFEMPDWTRLINIPFLNKKNQRFYITVTSKYKNLNDFERMKSDAIKDGVSKILQYHYKNSSEEIINQYLSYYKFADFEDYYIPYQPSLRIKCLISLPKKYLNAIEQKEIDLTDGNLVFNIKLLGLQKKIDKTVNLLKQYHKDMIYYKVRSADINLKRDYEGLLSFLDSLKKYLAINNIIFHKDKGMFEFSVDNCFNLINASYYNQMSCKYIKIGLSQMINEAPLNNSSLINFLYNLDIISKIEYCNLSWIDFINEYYFPKQNIPQLKNPLDKYINAAVSTFNSKLEIIPQQFSSKEELSAEIENLIKVNFSYTEDITSLEAKKRLTDTYQLLLKSFRESLVIEAGSAILLKDTKSFLQNISIENIIEKLKQINICEFSCQSLECLSLLIQVDVIEKTQISFTYEELKNDLIPSLTESEKKLLFSKILNNKAITKQSVYKLLKNYESDKEILKSIKTMTNEETIQLLIGYMIN